MIKATVQCLNVGWGDAHLIQLPSGSVCLIDGGDGTFSEDQDHPLSWMNRNGRDRLEWMILTHIHEDHINGLLDIAREKRVIKAVLPYEPFELPSEQLVLECEDSYVMRVFHMLNSYLELIHVLSDQGTEIKWRSMYGSNDNSVVWSDKEVTLTHLYPWDGDPLPAYEVLMKAVSTYVANGNSDEFTEILPSFFELSNDDSSVYRLSYVNEPSSSILFGGDQLEPGWERLAQRTDIRSRIWKVSHHGVQDGFNSRILSWIQPEHCIICCSVERSTDFQEEWDILRSRTDTVFHLTGDRAAGTMSSIDNGSIPVKIGM
ncbi:ComEC/Rec2 family competence protein [Paenibacillus sp. 1_12]|uniref:ComEC/Rec2 family competence protein n=1 Tax=Paenibacillus sp. 1_12 TaxID=1566278 RepID=UPI000B836893|nr:MBL fold metallo-hydrolase [Paenibacillus sp. 1_12]